MKPDGYCLKGPDGRWDLWTFDPCTIGTDPSWGAWRNAQERLAGRYDEASFEDFRLQADLDGYTVVPVRVVEVEE